MEITEEEIVQTYNKIKKNLMNYVVSIIHDTHRAEEILQEAFARLLRQDKLEIEHVSGWLFTVCRNLSFKFKKRDKVYIYNVYSMDDGVVHLDQFNHMTRLDEASKDTEQQNIFQYSPFDAACEKEEEHIMAVDLAEALKKLNPRLQKILRLRYFMEMTYTDIAKSMGISEDNVGYILHNAKRKLKKAYHNSFGVVNYVGENKNRYKRKRGAAAGTDDSVQPSVEGGSGGKTVRGKGVRRRRSKSCAT